MTPTLKSKLGCGGENAGVCFNPSRAIFLTVATAYLTAALTTNGLKKMIFIHHTAIRHP